MDGTLSRRVWKSWSAFWRDFRRRFDRKALPAPAGSPRWKRDGQSVARGVAIVFVLLVCFTVVALLYAVTGEDHHLHAELDAQRIRWRKEKAMDALRRSESVAAERHALLFAQQRNLYNTSIHFDKPQINRELSFDSGRDILDHLYQEILVAQTRSNTSAWDQVADQLVIGVKTGQEVAATRLEYVRKTWLAGRTVPQLIYLSDTSDASLSTVSVADYERKLIRGFDAVNRESGLLNGTFQGGWKGDKDKNLPAFACMFDRYPHKEFYLLVDDDTYLLLDNLAEYLLSEEVTRRRETPLYGGNLFLAPKGDASCFVRSAPRNIRFAHGGSGILLNHAAMNMMRESIRGCIDAFHTCWAGDIQVALCFHQVHASTANLKVINMCQDPPLRMMQKDSAFGRPERERATGRNRWRTDRKPITFHKFRSVDEYLDVARFDRITEARVGNSGNDDDDAAAAAADSSSRPVRTFDRLRRFLIERGYREAQEV